MDIFDRPRIFEWDKGNDKENLLKHGVTNQECEEVFFDPHKKMVGPVLQVGAEERYLLVGCTKKQRVLFLVFTIRRGKIRIISARDLSRKERRMYHEA